MDKYPESQWRPYDATVPLKDGTYIVRRWVPTRADNPHYGKILVVGGEIRNGTGEYITHYANEPHFNENGNITMDEHGRKVISRICYFCGTKQSTVVSESIAVFVCPTCGSTKSLWIAQ